LASLYNAGILVPDAYGRVERLKVQQAIYEGLGTDKSFAQLFGMFTAGYRAQDIDEQHFALDIGAKAKSTTGPGQYIEAKASDDRYLNIFRMQYNKDVMHQIAAGVRFQIGPPDPQCTTYPCIKRFDEFFAEFATPDGRIYAKQMGEIAGNIFKNGEHGVAADSTLFTHFLGFAGREYTALAGFLVCFGQKDEKGETYLSLDWAKTMEMDGVFPKGWTAKSAGWDVKTGKTWGTNELFPIMAEWHKQGVPGVPLQIQTAAGLTAMMSYGDGEKAT